MTKPLHFFFICCLGLVTALPVTTLAEVSSQQASEIARQHNPGRVLSVKQIEHQGRKVFQIKILNTRGEIHIILIDANSGERIGNP